jgi:parallel beta-helix repeat protein
MRLSVVLFAIVALMGLALLPLGTALAYPQANPSRALPGMVDKGETFNVTVNFTAPGNGFNFISLTDLAPGGWNVETNVSWCDPPIQTGVCFIRQGDSDSWEDAAGSGYNVCLRGIVTTEVEAPPVRPVHNINTSEGFYAIQAAIDAANTTAGHTITVDAETYNENVNVYKRLTIRSTSGNPADTIVNATNSSDHVFNVTASWVNITGFTVQNATGTNKAGIYLANGVSHCNISSNNAINNCYGIYLYSSSNNTLTNNNANGNYWWGIYLYSSSNNTLTNNNANGNYPFGIYLYSSSNNTLDNNTCSNDYDGIYLTSSSNNTLTNNTASSNDYDGIYMGSSSNNTLTNNTASSNDYDGIYLYSSSNSNTLTNNTASSNHYDGIYMGSSSNSNTLTNNTANGNYWWGISLSSSSNNTLTNNTASSNNYGISLSSSSNNTLTNNTASSNDYDGIDLYSSSNNNTLTNNTASSNEDGIALGSSSNNTLTNNTASSNEDGIYLSSSSNNNTLTNNTCSNDYRGISLGYSSTSNTLTNNTANGNYWFGILLDSSSNNTIYNNYFNNTNNAYDNGNNTWNTTNTTGPNIAGGPYIGGNYWSDYSGNDTDGDGFGETQLPYNCNGDITNGGDYLPLVPTAGATLQGHVDLKRKQTAGCTTWETPLVVRFFANGTKLEAGWSPINVTTDAYGNFTATGVGVGTYDVGVKNWTSLSRMSSGKVFSAGNTTTINFTTMGVLIEADTDNDDQVKLADFNRILANFGAKPGDPTWNEMYDFDRSGKIDLADFNLVLANFGGKGDIYKYTH